eukprot:TRINITY_DN67064_c0_g1_i1.p1 TRINITY_DN67064_c0_g1~~TRINITY_DN67064_c0_g1_i1.p1  ORF type:complete len:429 (+),score=80.84 TRINITY_DN67064_c0_g1_i1:44-1330(+)
MWAVWNREYARRAIRAGRGIALAGSIYGAGYAGGLHAYSSDPAGVTGEQVREVLGDIGALDGFGRPKLCHDKSEVVLRTRRVFGRILCGAREVTAELERKAYAAKEAARGRGWWAESQAQAELEKYQRAQKQLKEWSASRGVIVADVNTPNAFVHGLIPRMIFVQRGLFDMAHPEELPPSIDLAVKDSVFVMPSGTEMWVTAKVKSFLPADLEAGAVVADADTNKQLVVELVDGSEAIVPRSEVRGIGRYATIQTDEELAMLLGHEVSHVIHDHMGDSVQLLAFAAACQLAIIAMLDPTGFFSFGVEMCLGPVAKFALLLPGSRADEAEADRTGLQIVARAGYSPRDAAHFFARLAEAEGIMGGGSGIPSWASTHPSTEERAVAIVESEKDAMDLFEQKQQQATVTDVKTGRGGAGRWGFGFVSNKTE